ncbi:unnamed protein product [Didymodactylos carnosus]|uniref:Arginine deiminase n=1 Tax=Didymodactylos carnosus TaxID=1234261 RepID=A0A8S2DPL7_9BILA|nr:unnamed protein product [Didymodactylos carnosus]CAF3767613.1 unnamed protein product [Didymodactylos carnosus]
MEAVVSKLIDSRRMVFTQMNSLKILQEPLKFDVFISHVLRLRDGSQSEHKYNTFKDYSQKIAYLECELKHIQNAIDSVLRPQKVELNGVHSEAGRLETVLMHRSGKEINRLTSKNLDALLFDAKPNLDDTHRSHDMFADSLREHGVHILYLTDIIGETLASSKSAVHELINGIVENTDSSPHIKHCLQLWLEARQPAQLARDVIEGVACTADELEQLDIANLLPLGEFIVPPLPNIMFTRDSFSIIENKVVIHQMAFPARQNEPLIMSIIFKYYPKFVGHFELIDWQRYIPHSAKATMEGGDLAYVGDGTLIIGWSQRTNKYAIDALAQAMFDAGTLKRVIAVKIPESRDYMHLDTVMSSVGHSGFTLHTCLSKLMSVYEVTLDTNGSLRWVSKGSVETLDSVLGHTVTFYDSKTDEASVEDQRSCRHNALAIDECHVITYGEDDKENSIVTQMKQSSFIVFPIHTAGLLEGTGGAHCMTNALSRRSIE